MSEQLYMSSSVVQLYPQDLHGTEEPVPPSAGCGLSLGSLTGTVNVEVPNSPETLTTVFNPETVESTKIGWYVGAQTDLSGVIYTDSDIYRLIVTVSDSSASSQYRVSVSETGNAQHSLTYISGAHSSDLIVVNQKESSSRTTLITVDVYLGNTWTTFFEGDILISALTVDSEGIRKFIIPGP